MTAMWVGGIRGAGWESGEAQEALVFPVAEFSSFSGKHVVRIVGKIKCRIPTLIGLTSVKICSSARLQLLSFNPYVGLQPETPTRATGCR